uniref:Uncharacterized protein n=1 Tax=viral metagenome TaxID=1070528 RepID=A0A6C0H806_9ZZZZ
MSIQDVKIMETQITDNLKNNKKSNWVIMVILKGIIVGIKFIMKINGSNKINYT